MTNESDQKPEQTRVQIGSKVKVVLNNQPQTWQIVGLGQTDPSAGKISSEAPLTHFLLGLAVGEEKTGEINGRPIIAKIEAIF